MKHSLGVMGSGQSACKRRKGGASSNFASRLVKQPVSKVKKTLPSPVFYHNAIPTPNPPPLSPHRSPSPPPGCPGLRVLCSPGPVGPSLPQESGGVDASSESPPCLLSCPRQTLEMALTATRTGQCWPARVGLPIRPSLSELSPHSVLAAA